MSRSASGLAVTKLWLVVFLLSVTVIQGQDDWGVTYTSTGICAVKGSTVELKCTYRYPYIIEGSVTTVQEAIWFTKLSDKEPVDLRTDPDYAGRVQYSGNKNEICTLRITDLRESDSAVYKFRFITNQKGGTFSGSPGVTLTVTGLQVKAIKTSSCLTHDCIYVDLTCLNSCGLPAQTSYIWYKNGQQIPNQRAHTYNTYFYRPDSCSCALKEHEDIPAPSICVHGNKCNLVNHNDRSICGFRGSSVDISCTYNSHGSTTSKFWFHANGRTPVDLSADYWYAGRVHVSETYGCSTLRISDLRESDSAEYRFKFTSKGFEWGGTLPGTTLTVKDPDVQVRVFWSSSGPKLVCHSSCLLTGRSSFVWSKNGSVIQDEKAAFYGGNVDPADRYSCSYEGHSSTSVYGPSVPIVSMSRHGDVMKNSSVTLTCSSDANPAASYTWHKENNTLKSKDPQLVFSSIQSSDSGQYYCEAGNKLGKTASVHIVVDVKYGPEAVSLSVSPLGEIVEGSPFTLTCSSDANPAASYTWYKDNQTLRKGPESIFDFPSIGSADRGNYHCKSENEYGQINSTAILLDVQYAPKLPSVSMGMSAEIVEGSSVTLTCSSDANPAASYTWYKENEDSPKASGQIFTITDFRSELSGNYHCEAWNKRGRHNSTSYMIALPGANTTTTIALVTAFLLVLILLTVFLWVWRNKLFKQQFKSGERPDNRAQAPVCDARPAAADEHLDELQYASVHFTRSAHTREDNAIYSNIGPAQLHPRTQAREQDEAVEYGSIRTDSVPRTTRQEEEGCFALYSTVNKN